MSRLASLDTPRCAGLITPAEREVVEFFVHLGRYLSLPRSVGEIYGILFASGGTMTLDQLVSRLGISKGSASQGLRLLRGVGAVRVSYLAGDRKDHYSAEVELPHLLRVFLRDQLSVRLNHANERLGRLLEAVEDPASGAPEGLSQRVERLVSWQKKAKRLVPLVSTFLKM
ncbi:MAG: GbsR/MarR family transcriptional regulator [Chthoniobacterales bacterium]